MILEGYFDGSCDPNPGGRASWGFAIYATRDERRRLIYAESGVVGEGHGMTNNVAEISGFIALMKCLVTGNRGAIDMTEVREVFVRGDSMIVLGRVTGKYRKRPKGHFAPFVGEALRLVDDLSIEGFDTHYEWIPRLDNAHADMLATTAQG